MRADDTANPNNNYSIRITPPANLPAIPATLANTMAQLNLVADPARITLTPNTLNLNKGGTAEITVRAITKPIGPITVALTAPTTINIEPRNLVLSPTVRAIKAMISLADKSIDIPEQPATIRLSVRTGLGQGQANSDYTAVTILPDALSPANITFKPANTLSQGLGYGRTMTLIVTATDLASPANITIATGPQLKANTEQVTLAAGSQTMAEFMVTALANNIMNSQPRSDIVRITVPASLNLFSPIIALDTAHEHACVLHQNQTISCLR